MGPNAAAKAVHRPGDPRRPDRQPGPGGRRQAAGAARPRTERSRDEYLEALADASWRLTRGASWRSTRRRSGTLRARSRSAVARPARAIALAGRRSSSSRWSIIFVVSLGAADELDRIIARPSEPRQLPRARSTRRSCRRSSTRSATRRSTTVLSLAIGYPIAYWISRYGGRHKVAAADPRDAAVLDELPHPDLRLDDHPARQRRA